MWFLMALMAFFLIVFLVTRAVARGPGGIHDVGRQEGYDASLHGGASDGWGGPTDAGEGWGGAGAVGDGGMGGGGDGGGGG